MAVYSRGGNLPTTSSGGSITTTQTTPLASKDLGTIIVRSLQTVADSLSGGDVPVSYSDVERAVTKGINKSDLVKKGLKNGSLTSSGKADSALAAKYEQDKFIKWQEWQRKLQKEDEKDREEKRRRDEEIFNKTKAKVEETWNSIATGLRNPLKGISDTLDKSVKNFSTGFVMGFKSTLSNKNTVTRGASVANVTSSPEVSSISQKVTDLSDLIKDNFDKIEDNQESNNDDIQRLIIDDEKETKQDEDEKKGKENEDKKAKKAQLGATMSIGTAVGAAVGKVVAVVTLLGLTFAVLSQLFILAKGKIYEMLEQSPAKWDMRIANVVGRIKVIPDKVGLAIQYALSQIHFPGFKYGGLSDAEEDEKESLKAEIEKNEAMKDYYDAQKSKRESEDYLSDMDSLVNHNDYNLDDFEDRERYLGAIKQELLKTGLGEEYADYELRDFRLAAQNIASRNIQMDAILNGTSDEDRAKMERLIDLEARDSKGPMSQEEYERRSNAIYAKQQSESEAYLQGRIASREASGTLTQTYMNTLSEGGYNNIVQQWEDTSGRTIDMIPLSERETWLNEKYQPWEDAWKNFGKNMKLDFNIETSRNVDNPLNTNNK